MNQATNPGEFFVKIAIIRGRRGNKQNTKSILGAHFYSVPIVPMLDKLQKKCYNNSLLKCNKILSERECDPHEHHRSAHRRRKGLRLGENLRRLREIP